MTGEEIDTVLIVDDEPGMRRLLSEALRQEGYQVLEASDGLDALNVLEVWGARIGVVITDLRMPRLDGLALSNDMRSRFMKPTIFISGYSVEQRALPGPLFAKPFNVGALLASVRTHMEACRRPGPSQPA